MPTFKKTAFLAIFVFAIAMAGCSDEEDASEEAPEARLVKTVGHYNIVKYNGVVYGAPHGIEIDWEDDDLKNIPGMIVESSVDKTEKIINSIPAAQEPKVAAAPQMLKTVGRYNIVKYNGVVYGAPQGIGIDWQKDDLKNIPGMVVESSVEKAEQIISSILSQQESSIAATPTMVAEIGRYNIVKFNGNVYGAPQGVGIDWHKDDLPKIEGMIVGSSVILVEISAIGRQISDKVSRLIGAKKS